MKKNNTSVMAFWLGIISLVVCGVSAYLRPEVPLVWEISGGIALLAFAAYIFFERKLISEGLSRKTTRYGLNSLFMGILALGILIVVNLIANQYNVKKDLTKNHVNSLSEQSIKVLKGLKQDITLHAFINPTQMQEFENILDKYTYYSHNLKKDFVDVDKDPFAVQKYNIKQAGTIVVESDTRTARVDNLSGPDDPKLEEKLTNAIIEVAKGEKKKIYFITGHGEHLTSDSGRDGYSQMKEVLTEGRYNVEDLMLLNTDKIPADADILVDAGPKTDFMDKEYKTLEDYLNAGGKMLMMVEPTSPPSLVTFLSKYGVQWKPKTAVLETNSLQQLAGGNPLTPIVTQYDTAQEITQDAHQLSIFPIATPVEKAQTVPQGLNVASLFHTSARSLEVNVVGEKVKVDQKHDRQGPLSLALAISGKMPGSQAAKADPKAKADEKKPGEFRLVVVGDSDFASNSVKRFGINSDLFQNMLSWLAHEEDLISIRPRPTDMSQFEITEERERVINLASIVFAPLAMFISGFGVWATRRRL